VMMTIVCDGGAVIRCDISLSEPYPRQEIVIACDGRTFVLDALDTRAPLQIQAAAQHRGPRAEGQWAEVVTEHPLESHMAKADALAATFIAAVRSGDASATNTAALATASRVWEMARISMARGGEMISLTDDAASDVRRPEMRVIRGRGRRATDHPAPELTLVERTSPPQSA